MRAFFTLSFLFCLFFIGKGQAKKQSFTIDNVLFELSITGIDEANSKYCLYIKTSINTSFQPKDTVCRIVDNIDSEAFSIILNEAIRGLTTDKFVTDNESQIKKKTTEVFSKIENTEKFQKIEYGKELYLGLSEKEVEQLVIKKDSLRYYQDNYKKFKITNIKPSRQKIYAEELKQTEFYQQQEESNEEDSHQQQEESKNDSTAIRLVDTVRQKARMHIKLLRREINNIMEKRIPVVSFIGNANVVASYKIADQTQINAGFGINVSKPLAYDFIGVLTVAQASDTIVSSAINDFGQSLLIPGVRRFSLLTSFRNYSFDQLASCFIWRKLGWAFNVNITPYQWSLRKSDGTPDSISARVVPVAVDMLLPFTWVSIYKENKDISISTDIGLSFRYVGGNVTKDNLTSFIGRETRLYPGLLFGLNIKYNGLRAQFHGPIFFGKHVDGLTNGQVFASIGFVSSILSNESGILKKK